MLKTSLEVIRALIASPEALFLVAICVVWFYFPEGFAAVGSAIRSNDKLAPYSWTVPAIVLGWGLVQAKSVLFPVKHSDARRPLKLWPDYWRLKLRTALSLIWMACGVIAAVAIQLAHSDVAASTYGAITIATVAVPLIVAGHLYWAGIVVRELTEK